MIVALVISTTRLDTPPTRSRSAHTDGFGRQDEAEIWIDDPGPTSRGSIIRIEMKKDTGAAAAGPVTSSAGNGPQPRLSAPDSGIGAGGPSTKARAGVPVSPVPRNTEASMLAIQMIG